MQSVHSSSKTCSQRNVQGASCLCLASERTESFACESAGAHISAVRIT